MLRFALGPEAVAERGFQGLAKRLLLLAAEGRECQQAQSCTRGSLPQRCRAASAYPFASALKHALAMQLALALVLLPVPLHLAAKASCQEKAGI